MHIFLDESGDLGHFSSRSSSQFFVITLLACKDKETLNVFKKAVTRTLAKINPKSKPPHTHELKGTDTTLLTKKYFLKKIIESENKDWRLFTTIFHKQQYHMLSKLPKQRIYNHLAKFVLDQVDFSSQRIIRLTVDKCKGSSEQALFNNYLLTHFDAKLPINTRLDIEHVSSQDNKLLQAVDLFCWGIARKYSLDDQEWYQLYSQFIEKEVFYDP